MLRRVENVELGINRDLWGFLVGSRYRVLLTVGRKSHTGSLRQPVAEWRAMRARSDSEPVAFLTLADRTYWCYREQWFSDNEGLEAGQVHALLDTRALKRENQIARAETIAAQGRLPEGSLRTSVSSEVRLLVWQRDGGRCVFCSSMTEIQLDHVIPVSMGGSNTEENLQILCGPCNRRKGAAVG